MAEEKKKSHYITAKESRKIAKENIKITREFEKRKKRKPVESEYVTQMKNPENIVEFEDLHTYFYTDTGVVKAVNGVSFSMEKGKTLAIVGESGSGKSVSAMSILRLLDENGYIDGGEILFDKTDLVKLPMEKMYFL